MLSAAAGNQAAGQVVVSISALSDRIAQLLWGRGRIDLNIVSISALSDRIAQPSALAGAVGGNVVSISALSDRIAQRFGR